MTLNRSVLSFIHASGYAGRRWLAGTLIVIAGMVPIFTGSSAQGETLSYADLVHRLVDLEGLAVLPTAGERCTQWSSYDRASRYDEQTGTYVSWFANGDGSGFIRKEGDKIVMAEMDGPGVIWRIWSAKTDAGHVRIYLDGDEQPVVDLPFAGYFDGKHAPFNQPNLAYMAAKGLNCYVPIPYQKSCKIVADPGWGAYYHFTYSTFPADTQVPTFKLPLPADDAAALAKVNERLDKLGELPGGEQRDSSLLVGTVELSPGETETILNVTGRRAITALYMVPEIDEPDRLRDALREIVLRIWWDDEPEASVQVPIGDFFGAIPGVKPYRSLPVGITDQGYYSLWFMPFGASAKVSLTNESATAGRLIRYRLVHAALDEDTDPDTLGRFHARWHQGLGENPDRPIDWTLLRTGGQGRFVGVMLHVSNPGGGWWGEGDEKFFVDGEKFPSTYGTGSEDYFGYAWCDVGLFARAFHGQTLSVPENGCVNRDPQASGGQIVNYRWQIADNIPFHNGIDAAIEKYFGEDRLTRYACTVYWYQRESDRFPVPLPPVEDRRLDRLDRDAGLFALMHQIRGYDGKTPIAPIRDACESYLAEPRYQAYFVELTVLLASAYAKAGDRAEAQLQLESVIDQVAVPFVLRDLADEVFMIRGKPGPDEPVRPLLVRTDDGSSKVESRDGRYAVVTQIKAGKPFVYFSLPKDSPWRNGDRDLKLVVHYQADGSAGRKLQVQYDSATGEGVAGMYRPTAEVEIPSASGWSTMVVELPRARMAGRQNAKADFRVASNGEGDIAIGDIEISAP